MRKIGKQASIVADGTLPIEGVISIPKADDKVPAVSLASCIAKVMRDAYMVKASKKYPAYGFEENMGYGVPKHQAALEEFGPCEIHRMSYGPVKKAASRLTEPKNMWEMDE
jgi:ribonuclease HII